MGTTGEGWGTGDAEHGGPMAGSYQIPWQANEGGPGTSLVIRKGGGGGEQAVGRELDNDHSRNRSFKAGFKQYNWKRE